MVSSSKRSSFVAASSGLWLLAPALLSAQGIRVSAPLRHAPGGAGEDVGAVYPSPDGRWVVYTADPDAPDLHELFSVPVDGSAPSRKISGTLVAGGALRSRIVISPTGERVVYAADQETDGVLELFAVPIDGGTPPVKLTGALVAGGDVLDSFQVTRDGTRVVYVADAHVDERFALFSARMDGQGIPTNLSGWLGPAGQEGDVDETFRLSPDGRTVVFLADKTHRFQEELWAAPVTGDRPPIKLNGPLLPWGDVSLDFDFTPDGLGVLYVAVEDTFETRELYHAAIDGSTPPLRLNPPLVAGGNVDAIVTLPFQASSDGATVVYRADQETDGVFELFSVPITGGAVRRLNAALVPGGDVADLFLISADGTRVVYAADQARDGVVELFSAPIDGSAAPLRLNSALVEGGAVDRYHFELSPDGARAVYSADQERDDVYELWSVPVDGSSPAVRLNDPFVAGGSQTPGFELSPDGACVVYLTDQRQRAMWELWSVPIDRARGPTRLNGPLATLGDVLRFDVTGDSLRVVYTADQGMDERFELWSVPIDRSQQPVKLNVALDGDAVVGDVSEFAWSPDGKRLVYAANQESAEYYAYPFVGVFSADLTHPAEGRMPVIGLGSGEVSAMPAFTLSPAGGWVAFRETSLNPAAEQIHGRVVSTSIEGQAPYRVVSAFPGVAERFRYAPDGSRLLVYQVALVYDHPPYGQGLFSVPSDGSAAPACLSEPQGLQLGLDVGRYAVDAGGTRAVFVEHRDGAHLYSAALDGSSAAVELNEPFVDPAQDVLTFELAPEGDAVVFVADAHEPGVFELLRTSLEGGAAPVRLGPPPGAGRGVDAAIRFTADGTRVVYAAEYEAAGGLELWSVPIDPERGCAPARLSPAPVAGGGVGPALPRLTDDGSTELVPQFELSPDGSRVVYRADLESDEVYELFSVPSDGRAPSVRLHPPLGSAQDAELFGFRFTPDGLHVVFVADLLANDVLELFRVPTDGSAPPQRISAPLVPGGNLWTQAADGAARAFALTPDSATVVYLADQRADEVFELFAAPLDGSSAARVLNAGLVAGGDVGRPDLARAPFALSPDGALIAYLADQRIDEVVELFVSHLDPPRVRATRMPAQAR